MLGYREADANEAAAWEDRWRARLTAWFASYGYDEVSTDARVAQMVDRRRRGESPARLVVLREAGQDVGTLAFRRFQDVDVVGYMIEDVFIAPEHRRRGLARAAVALVWDLAGDNARINAMVDPGDPAQV